MAIKEQKNRKRPKIMDWKKIGKKLLFPHVLIIFCFICISAAALVYVFINRLETAPVAYVSYVFSFYTLTVLVIYLCMVLPKRYHSIKKRIYDNPWGNRYMTDAAPNQGIITYILGNSFALCGNQCNACIHK